MDSPVMKKAYLDMKKGEEFFVRNMLAPGRSGTEILNDTNVKLTKKYTDEIDRSKES